MPNTIERLYTNGQSIWCDNISRHLIDSGELERLVDLGVGGVTSNPSIFMKAITEGTDYDQRLQHLIDAGKRDMDLYEGLVLPDIADAADILKPVYEYTDGVDGYVSLEVNPSLAHDTRATILEARRLWHALNRSNVMIKVPATQEGLPAVEILLGEGINVNVTLIFALSMYENVMQAYIAGLAKFHAAGGDVSKVASVASFFVSRLDTAVDTTIAEMTAKLDDDADDENDPTYLLGQAAVANAKLAYERFEQVFGTSDGVGESDAFAAMADVGARVQRPLWASTSTKNPELPPTMYVDQLVAPRSVNTIPPATMQAVLDEGSAGVMIYDELDAARETIAHLARFGIDLEAATDKLRIDGVAIFAQSFDDLLANLEEKRQRVSAA